jgi:hypothetical protein
MLQSSVCLSVCLSRTRRNCVGSCVPLCRSHRYIHLTLALSTRSAPGPCQFIDPTAGAEPSPTGETSHNGISRVYPTSTTVALRGGKWRNISFETLVKMVQRFRTFAWNVTSSRNKRSIVRFEVFAAVTMKDGVFWEVMPCGSCKN